MIRFHVNPDSVHNCKYCNAVLHVCDKRSEDELKITFDARARTYFFNITFLSSRRITQPAETFKRY